MNSKIIFLLILLFAVSSCGVKAPPEKYPATVIDSYIKDYTGGDPTPEEIARTKDKKSVDKTSEPAKVPTLIPQP